jgi:hypothetical protein
MRPGKGSIAPGAEFRQCVARVQRSRLSEGRLANGFESAMVDAA